MAVSYSEKLRDPRWQKKRLEVMHERDFACENCGEQSQTLHVHHGWYERGLNPWEYPSYCYQCLCHNCHQRAEDIRLYISQKLFSQSVCQLEGLADFLNILSKKNIKISRFLNLLDNVNHEEILKACSPGHAGFLLSATVPQMCDRFREDEK